jgi:hypothetical protein
MSTPAPVRGGTPPPHLDDETRALINALAAVNGNIPRVVTMLAQDQLPIVKQLEFAELLTDLCDLLVEHATSRAQTPADQPQPIINRT